MQSRFIDENKYVPFIKPYLSGPVEEYKGLQQNLQNTYDENVLKYDALQEAADNMQSLDAAGDLAYKKEAFDSAKKDIENAAKAGDYENQSRLVRKAFRDFSTKYRPIAEQVATRNEVFKKIDENKNIADKTAYKTAWMKQYKESGGLKKNPDGTTSYGFQHAYFDPADDVDLTEEIKKAVGDAKFAEHSKEFQTIIKDAKNEDLNGLFLKIKQEFPDAKDNEDIANLIKTHFNNSPKVQAYLKSYGRALGINNIDSGDVDKYKSAKQSELDNYTNPNNVAERLQRTKPELYQSHVEKGDLEQWINDNIQENDKALGISQKQAELNNLDLQGARNMFHQNWRDSYYGSGVKFGQDKYENRNTSFSETYNDVLGTASRKKEKKELESLGTTAGRGTTKQNLDNYNFQKANIVKNASAAASLYAQAKENVRNAGLTEEQIQQLNNSYIKHYNNGESKDYNEIAKELGFNLTSEQVAAIPELTGQLDIATNSIKQNQVRSQNIREVENQMKSTGYLDADKLYKDFRGDLLNKNKILDFDSSGEIRWNIDPKLNNLIPFNNKEEFISFLNGANQEQFKQLYENIKKQDPESANKIASYVDLYKKKMQGNVEKFFEDPKNSQYTTTGVYLTNPHEKTNINNLSEEVKADISLNPESQTVDGQPIFEYLKSTGLDEEEIANMDFKDFAPNTYGTKLRTKISIPSKEAGEKPKLVYIDIDTPELSKDKVKNSLLSEYKITQDNNVKNSIRNGIAMNAINHNLQSFNNTFSNGTKSIEKTKNNTYIVEPFLVNGKPQKGAFRLVAKSNSTGKNSINNFPIVHNTDELLNIIGEIEIQSDEILNK